MEVFTIRVIPIARGVGKEELTYFAPHEVRPGMVIEVPLRKKQVPALVVVCEPVHVSKAELRTGAFTLRRIGRKEPRKVVSAAFIQAARDVATWHVMPTGAVLSAFIPSVVLSAPKKAVASAPPPERPAENLIGKVLQAPRARRLDFYRTLTREAFARGASAFLIAPTIVEATRLFEDLERGIGEYAFLLTSALSKSEYLARHELVLAHEHPVLLVGTPSALSNPRHDLGLIMLEREASPLYRLPVRGGPDARLLARYLAKHRKAELVRADLPLSIHGIHARDTGKVEEIVTGHHRTTFSSKAYLLDQTGTSKAPDQAPWKAVSRTLIDELTSHTTRNHPCFLYVARRGLSPITVCRDCGAAVECHECGASVVLHKGKEENYFLCHSCGAMRHAREVCKVCRSWRLESLGIGVELVERELREALPKNVPIHTLSSDSAKTHIMALRIAQQFHDFGGVLIGTELALPYLSEVPFSAVVSLDALLSFPSWTTYERIASILTRMRELSGETLLVQTRRPETNILRYVLEGNFSAYYKQELLLRKKFGYPPFSTLIKVTASGTERQVADMMERAKETLAPYDLVTLSHFLRSGEGGVLLHGFLRVPRATWPDHTLIHHLRSLPPHLSIVVDPETVL